MRSIFLGFYLLEILTALIIIGILTAISLPLYVEHAVKIRRFEAAEKLSHLAVALEQYHIEHNTYEHATLAALHFAETTPNHQYRFIIQTALDDNYLIVAQPLLQQAANDTECGALTLTAKGEKGATGTEKVDRCW